MECPICLEWLRPPVSTCVNGHGICVDCRKSVQICAVCRGKFTTTKNTLLNKITESFLHNSLSSPNSRAAAESKTHEIEKRKVSCYACSEENIALSKLNDHINDKHKKWECQAITKLSTFVLLRQPLKYKYSFRFIYITDIKSNFIVKFLYKADQKILFLFVEFVGKNLEDARNFVFDVKVNQGSSDNKSLFKCSGLCLPYNQYVVAYKEAEMNRRIIQMNLEKIFFNDAYLSGFNLEVQIRPVK